MAQASAARTSTRGHGDALTAPSSYEPLENYGLIGNCRTAALVSLHGSVDWLCLPHFSGP
jgi:hypothetical protein